MDARKIKEPKTYFYLKYAIPAMIVFVIFVYLYLVSPPIIISKIGNLIQAITLIIFTITGLLAIQTFWHQSEDRCRNVEMQYVQLTQGVSADIDKLFLSNKLLDRLYFQMYEQDPTIKMAEQMTGPIKDDPDRLKAEHIAAGLIFQKMADLYTCEKLDQKSIDELEWVSTFRGWMKSPILLSHWDYLKHEIHPNVQNYIESYIIDPHRLFVQRQIQKQTQNQMNNRKILEKTKKMKLSSIY
jgi:hypothetical protein